MNKRNPASGEFCRSGRPQSVNKRKLKSRQVFGPWQKTKKT